MTFPSVFLAFVWLVLASCKCSHSLPLQVTINQRQSECLYEILNKGESVTVSVFVLSGNQLKATYSLEGPIADVDVKSGTELYTKGEEHPPGKRNTNLAVTQEVDFEHLMDEIDDDDQYDDDDNDDDDEYNDDAPIDPGDPDAEKKKKGSTGAPEETVSRAEKETRR